MFTTKTRTAQRKCFFVEMMPLTNFLVVATPRCAIGLSSHRFDGRCNRMWQRAPEARKTVAHGETVVWLPAKIPPPDEALSQRPHCVLRLA
jgi:hypothetical protein